MQVFNTCIKWWAFTGVLSDSKPTQVSRTLLTILADLNHAAV